MKDGRPPPPRLSEKLNSDLERLREENAALTTSQLASFRTDLQAIVRAALTTIEADTKAFESWNETLWRNHRNAVTRAILIRSWMLLSAVILLTMTLALVTWVWIGTGIQTERMTSLETLGMELHNDLTGTFLTFDPSRMNVTRCSHLGREVPCFRVEE